MGKMIEVDATAQKKDKDGKAVGTPMKCTVTYDFGDTLTEASKKFGENEVYSGFVANAKVELQAGLRRTLLAGGDVKAFATSWKPGVKVQRVVDPIAAAKAKYASMSKEERAAFLASLKEMG
jgi:hypothetical protein